MAPLDDGTFGQNPYAGMDPAQGFTRKSLLESESSALAEKDAMGYLTQALRSQREVSATQGIAAALLAAIPTFGGYLLGNSVGQSKIPAGLYGAGLDKLAPTGGAAGGAAGAKIGEAVAGDYFKTIEADNLAARKVAEAKAQIKKEEADAYRQQAAVSGNYAANIEADLAKMPYELQQFARQQEIMKQRELSVAAANRDRDLLPAAANAVVNQTLGLPADTRLTAQEANAVTNTAEVSRRQEGFEWNKKKAILPGYKNLSGGAPDSATIKELASENMGVQKTKNLIGIYLSNPDKFTGDASAVQAAVSGMLVNAQRQATGSGSNFTEMEKGLISAALPKAIAGGDLMGWIKAQMLGRNQQAFAKTLMDIYQKQYDYSVAEAYGQFREDVPKNYYPTKVLARFPDAFPAEAEYEALKRKKMGLE